VKRCYPEHEILACQVYVTRVCEVYSWNEHWYFTTLIDLQFDTQNSCLFNSDLFILVYLSCLFSIANLDDWLTVVNLQFDAQNSYLFNFDLYVLIYLSCLFSIADLDDCASSWRSTKVILR
jgi:hypothetical protein